MEHLSTIVHICYLDFRFGLALAATGDFRALGDLGDFDDFAGFSGLTCVRCQTALI